MKSSSPDSAFETTAGERIADESARAVATVLESIREEEKEKSLKTQHSSFPKIGDEKLDLPTNIGTLLSKMALESGLGGALGTIFFGGLFFASTFYEIVDETIKEIQTEKTNIFNADPTIIEEKLGEWDGTEFYDGDVFKNI